jgi:hypothetical protein
MDTSRITAARHALLALHKALIDAAQIELERIEGRLTGNQMLDRLVNDEQLAWLSPMTAIIIGFDELLEAEDASPGQVAAHVGRTIELLTPADDDVETAFATAYARLLQDRPEVTMAHAEVMKRLR